VVGSVIALLASVAADISPFCGAELATPTCPPDWGGQAPTFWSYDRRVTNWYTPETLTHFKSPPVVETAMGVEFAPINALGFLNLAELQKRWADRYPKLDEMPALPSSIGVVQGVPQFRLMEGGPDVRVWATGVDDGLLVQTQRDRLILNWRKAFGDGTYPGYDTLRSKFEAVWADLISYLNEMEQAQPVPTSAEFTYVNHVGFNEGENIEDVLSVVSHSDRPLPGESATTQLQVVRVVQQSETDPFTAQIEVTGSPQFIENRRVLAMNVTTKVLFATGGDVLQALDAAHALSSHTFDNITSLTKHQEWELQ
jgi:uncharacterized protein (TIGR04255 family)